MTESREVFVTGATGYMGRALVAELRDRGHRVRALSRPESRSKLPAGASVVLGDALQASSFAAALNPGDTLVHLVGTPHPNPSKAAEFRRVDLASILASVQAARQGSVAHLVYVSVARPAPVMREYIAVREQGEAAIAEAGLTATVLRPWYVLGPGHRWPIVLTPMYALAERLPVTRNAARRLALVTLQQMVGALVFAVENPPERGRIRTVDVQGIRSRE